MDFIHSYMDAVGGFLKTESDAGDTHQPGEKIKRCMLCFILRQEKIRNWKYE